MKEMTVIKLDLEGNETWRYQAHVLAIESGSIVLEAFFDREDMEFHGLLLCKGDRFVEAYYTDKWYNIYEIHARENDKLRGWYCNICCPAVIKEDVVSYIDLALDLVVFPDGKQIILDEEEFSKLPLTAETQKKAKTALGELQEKFNKPASIHH